MKNLIPKKVCAYTSAIVNVLNKPQRKYLAIYLTGIIRIVKFRSIKEIARQFAHGNTDGLHHFIKNTVQKTVSIENAGKQYIANCVKGKNSILVIDDTAQSISGKKKNEGVFVKKFAISEIPSQAIYWFMCPMQHKFAKLKFICMVKVKFFCKVIFF